MRTSSLRLFVPLFLAVSSVVAPVSAHAAPVSVSAKDGISVTGLYRLTLSAANRKAKTVHLVVRVGDTGISGVLLDKDAEVELTNFRIEGTMLKGGMMTSEGYGEIQLDLSQTIVRGTLTVDGKRLTIEGDHHN
ncbi:MAG TPA: hypothetical protein VGP25_04040 [Gemmatimonadaceae bacterium]|nr:hypothetical protein [Gemmatimonadaceae bacterium]